MQTKNILSSAMLFIALTIPTAFLHAGPSNAVSLQVTNYGSASTQVERDAVDAIFTQLQTEFNTEIEQNLPDIGTDFLDKTGNANTFGIRGITSDYSNTIDLFSLSLGAGVATDPFPPETDAENLGGASTGQSVALGLNLASVGVDLPDIGPLKLSQSIAYINAFGGSFDVDPLKSSFFSLGMHLSAPIVEPASVGLGVFSWGGVNLTSGFDYNSTEITVEEQITVTEQTGSFSGIAAFGADTSTFTIPIEASTSLRLFWVFTVFGGLGLDINFGSASSVVAIRDGVITDSLTSAAGSATLNISESGGPSFLGLRGFAGVQLGLGPVAFFGQFNQSLTGSVAGASGGVRVVW